MSYIRGEFYTYVSGPDGDEVISFAEKYMPLEIFDELVAMRSAEMLEEGALETAAERAVLKYSGNVGCSALRELRELPSWKDMMIKALGKKEGLENPQETIG